MSARRLPEELAVLVETIVGDPGLRDWIMSLRDLPETERSRELQSLFRRMQEAGEKQDLVRTAAFLANPRIYQALCFTLEELGP